MMDMIIAAKDRSTPIKGMKYFADGIVERLEGRDKKPPGGNGNGIPYGYKPYDFRGVRYIVPESLHEPSVSTWMKQPPVYN